MGMLDGRVVLVTGAGRGIGRAIARALGVAGAGLMLNDRGAGVDGTGADTQPVVTLADELHARGVPVLHDGADVADEQAVEVMFGRTLDHFGRLDGVVNCAGILRDRMIFSMTAEDWDAVMRVHLRGHFLVTAAACRHWRERAKASGGPVSGRIVCTTSEAGLFGHPGQANYSAAKAGIVGLGVVVAREMDRYGVTSNVIAPRARTRMTEGAFGSFGEAEGPHPWDPENVAPLVTYLLSEAGGACTGQIFVAGGGVLQHIAHHAVTTEIALGAGTPSLSEVAAFVEDTVGLPAAPPPFPDLGLPAGVA